MNQKIVIQVETGKMHSMRSGSRLQLLEGLILVVAVLHLLIVAAVSARGDTMESQSFYSFIRAVDPQNVLKINWNGLLPHPCSHKLKGPVKCNVQTGAITEIRLERLSLSGRINGKSLCKLQNLQVLSLANNFVHGSIPDSISNCAALTYLNLSSNLLSGRIPSALRKMKNLRTLDISTNFFTTPNFRKYVMNFDAFAAEASASQPTGSNISPSLDKGKQIWVPTLPLIIGICFCILFTYFMGKKSTKLAREKEILKALKDSPSRTPPVMFTEEVKPEEKRSDLVFFVEEHEKFKLEDLLEATADLRSQSITSSLYKVILKNNVVYAVKRLKKLQVSFEEFCQTMRQMGNLRHPNILPLVGFNSTDEEKLLIYKYQSNGSLLNLMGSKFNVSKSNISASYAHFLACTQCLTDRFLLIIGRLHRGEEGFSMEASAINSERHCKGLGLHISKVSFPGSHPTWESEAFKHPAR